MRSPARSRNTHALYSADAGPHAARPGPQEWPRHSVCCVGGHRFIGCWGQGKNSGQSFGDAIAAELPVLKVAAALRLSSAARSARHLNR